MQMKIDIDRLTEAELVDLNHRIVARLRFLQQMRAHADMLEFKIGDRVTFRPSGQQQIEGMLGSVDIYLAAMTAAARLMLALKLSTVLSYRVAMERNSLILAK